MVCNTSPCVKITLEAFQINPCDRPLFCSRITRFFFLKRENVFPNSYITTSFKSSLLLFFNWLFLVYYYVQLEESWKSGPLVGMGMPTPLAHPVMVVHISMLLTRLVIWSSCHASKANLFLSDLVMCLENGDTAWSQKLLSYMLTCEPCAWLNPGVIYLGGMECVHVGCICVHMREWNGNACIVCWTCACGCACRMEYVHVWIFCICWWVGLAVIVKWIGEGGGRKFKPPVWPALTSIHTHATQQCPVNQMQLKTEYSNVVSEFQLRGMDGMLCQPMGLTPGEGGSHSHSHGGHAHSTTTAPSTTSREWN